MERTDSAAAAESSFSHDYEDGGATTAAQTPSSSAAASPPTGTKTGRNGGGAVATNLRRFYGMGNAAVGGLIEFGAKYGRSFDDPYDEFEDRRFFDSRDYRCCWSIFHAKIGTFIFCTLILHEIVLGTIYLLTQMESSEANASRMVALLICRLLQFPPMALLYVALWRHQRWLLLPFAVSQLTLGAFTDISTFMLIMAQLESADAWILFSGELKWLNLVVPLSIYTLISIALMWVLYKCFIFLHARRKHDLQRKADKQREHEALLMRTTTTTHDETSATTGLESGEKMMPATMLPDEVMIVTTEKIDPTSASGEEASISSEAATARPPQRHQFSSSSVQNRHSSCQFQYYPRYDDRHRVGHTSGIHGGAHLRTGSEPDHQPILINAALSALVLNKVQGDENSGGVRSSTLPPPPPSALLGARQNRRLASARATPTIPYNNLQYFQQHQQPRRRLTSEMAAADPMRRAFADAEFTALMLQHRNPRSSHLRGFRGSAYSLQDYLKFHINVEKANSATPTMVPPASAGPGTTTPGGSALGGETRRISSGSSTVPDGVQPSGSSCTSSTQSLTLVEPTPGGLSPSGGDITCEAASSDSSSNAINFTTNSNAGEKTPTPITMRNPFTKVESANEKPLETPLSDNETTPTVELKAGPFATGDQQPDVKPQQSQDSTR